MPHCAFIPTSGSPSPPLASRQPPAAFVLAALLLLVHCPEKLKGLQEDGAQTAAKTGDARALVLEIDGKSLRGKMAFHFLFHKLHGKNKPRQYRIALSFRMLIILARPPRERDVFAESRYDSVCFTQDC